METSVTVRNSWGLQSHERANNQGLYLQELHLAVSVKI